MSVVGTKVLIWLLWNALVLPFDLLVGFFHQDLKYVSITVSHRNNSRHMWYTFIPEKLNVKWLNCTGEVCFLKILYTESFIKEKILKAAREKQQITYRGIPISLTADLSAQILQARREWQEIFKVMKGKNLQPRLLYPARISFRCNGELNL